MGNVLQMSLLILLLYYTMRLGLIYLYKPKFSIFNVAVRDYCKSFLKLCISCINVNFDV